jgi:formate dehydrogenase assembly factor FdhD
VALSYRRHDACGDDGFALGSRGFRAWLLPDRRRRRLGGGNRRDRDRGPRPGIDVQITLKDAANTRFEARRRRLAGPVGCGLCGIESIEEAMRSVDSVAGSSLALEAADIASAVRLLAKAQPMHAETGAVHAAGFYVTGKGIVAAREDVGRHNALDKLAGALAKAGIDGRPAPSSSPRVSRWRWCRRPPRSAQPC